MLKYLSSSIKVRDASDFFKPLTSFLWPCPLYVTRKTNNDVITTDDVTAPNNTLRPSRVLLVFARYLRVCPVSASLVKFNFHFSIFKADYSQLSTLARDFLISPHTIFFSSVYQNDIKLRSSFLLAVECEGEDDQRYMDGRPWCHLIASVQQHNSCRSLHKGGLYHRSSW